jgi:hypothetical protein
MLDPDLIAWLRFLERTASNEQCRGAYGYVVEMIESGEWREFVAVSRME